MTSSRVALLGLLLAACKSNPEKPPTRLTFIAGTEPVLVRLGPDTFTVDARASQERTLRGTVESVQATVAGVAFEVNLGDQYAGQHVVVPVSNNQCFVEIDPTPDTHTLVLSKQTTASPLPTKATIVAPRANHAPLATKPLVGQVACSAVAQLSDKELADVVLQGATFQDVVAVAPAQSRPHDANADTLPSPALLGFIDQVDLAVGLKHAAAFGGKMTAALWHRNGNIAVANLASEAFESRAADAQALRAKQTGANIKRVLAGVPLATASVYSLDDFRVIAVSRETALEFANVYQDVQSDDIAIAGTKATAVRFFYEFRSASGLWVAAPLHDALANIGIDLRSQLQRAADGEAAAVQRCLATLAEKDTVHCSKYKTQHEAALRLHYVLRSKPTTDFYVAVIANQATGGAELWLAKAPIEVNADDRILPYSLKITASGPMRD